MEGLQYNTHGIYLIRHPQDTSSCTEMINTRLYLFTFQKNGELGNIYFFIINNTYFKFSCSWGSVTNT